MDTKTVKSISENAGYGARYDTKLKIWRISKDGQPSMTLTYTSVQLHKMVPDQLRRLLGVKPNSAPAKAKANGERKPRGAYDPEAKITLLQDNPKRPGSKAHTLYALYKGGMTVAAYIEAGGTLDALRWDVARKFISVSSA